MLGRSAGSTSVAPALCRAMSAFSKSASVFAL